MITGNTKNKVDQIKDTVKMLYKEERDWYKSNFDRQKYCGRK